MTNPNAMTQLTELTVKLTAQALGITRNSPDHVIDRMAEIVGHTVKNSFDKILSEWELCADATVSDATLQQFFLAQAGELATQAANANNAECSFCNTQLTVDGKCEPCSY